MPTVKTTVRRQVARTTDAIASVHSPVPSGGWIATFRTALGMSATDLARLLGISQSGVSKAQAAEVDGAITLNRLQEFADAMGGKLVYAIVPKQGGVDDLVMDQARKKANRVVKRARAHMALEQQSEGLSSEADAIEELAQELAREMKRGFWS